MKKEKLFALTMLIMFISTMSFSQLAIYGFSAQNRELDHNLGATKINISSLSSNYMIFVDNSFKASVNVTRTVRISPYGVITLNDTIRIYNRDNREFNAILIFYEQDLYDQLVDLRFVGKSSKEDKYYNLESFPYIGLDNFVGIAIKLEKFVEKNEGYTVKIVSIVDKVPKIDVKDNELYLSIQFPQKPLLQLNITELEIIFKTDDKNAHIYEDELSPKTNGTKISEQEWKYQFSNIITFNASSEDNQNDQVYFIWRTTQPMIQILNYEKEIRFYVTSKVKITEKIQLIVVAPPGDVSVEEAKWKIDSIVIGIPEDVENLNARDFLGKLKMEKTTSEIIPEGYTPYSIEFRVPISISDIYTFSMSYEIPAGSDLFEVKDDKWTLEIPIAPVINATINNVKTRIIIPSGYTLKSIKYKNSTLNTLKLRQSEFLGILSIEENVYYAKKVSMMDNQIVEIEINTSLQPILEIFFKIFLLTLLVVVLVDLIIAKLKRREVELAPEEIEARKILKERLERFIKTYEEFIAIETELDSFIREKLRVRKSPKMIRENLSKLMRETKRYKDRINLLSEGLSSDKELYNIVKEMLSIEDRIEFARRELISDWSQFLSGKLGKNELMVRARSTFDGLKTYKLNRTRLLNRLRNIYALKYVKK